MKLLVDKTGISRSLTRMAHEIIERNKGVDDIVLLGIKTRGVFLAKRLKEYIDNFEGSNVLCTEIDISFWRDDKEDENFETHIIDVDIKDKIVIIVDDVLYSGRTVRAAMDGVFHNARAREIQLAVLVDRGHRQLPIRADYVGKNLPTSSNEEVSVLLEEIDNEEGIYIGECIKF